MLGNLSPFPRSPRLSKGSLATHTLPPSTIMTGSLQWLLLRWQQVPFLGKFYGQASCGCSIRLPVNMHGCGIALKPLLKARRLMKKRDYGVSGLLSFCYKEQVACAGK